MNELFEAVGIVENPMPKIKPVNVDHVPGGGYDNYRICYNPPKWYQHNCPECWVYRRCICHLKQKYRKK